MKKLDKNIGAGVHKGYQDRAREGGDILFHCTIKGRDILVSDIPLHMSLKVFFDKKDIDIEEIKTKVKEFNIEKPDPNKMKFATTIFESERDGKKYYMLLCDGVPDNYEKFYHSFGNKGTTYKNFIPHVTIDKSLYDEINKEGIKPEEVIFNDLTIEYGAGNTAYTFKKSEELEKGGFKNLASAIAIAGAMTVGGAAHAPQPKPDVYSPTKMLSTISQVESSGGKNTQHEALGGIHQGESAYGKYGLTPVTIRETIHLNEGLQKKHKKAMNLRGQDLHHYMQDNPELENQIAQKHLQRLEHHFGQNPDLIAYSWLQGIRGTNKAIKEKKDIKNHWHVKKILKTYAGEK